MASSRTTSHFRSKYLRKNYEKIKFCYAFLAFLFVYLPFKKGEGVNTILLASLRGVTAQKKDKYHYYRL